jgi:hypothetical protein
MPLADIDQSEAAGHHQLPVSGTLCWKHPWAGEVITARRVASAGRSATSPCLLMFAPLTGDDRNRSLQWRSTRVQYKIDRVGSSIRYRHKSGAHLALPAMWCEWAKPSRTAVFDRTHLGVEGLPVAPGSPSYTAISPTHLAGAVSGSSAGRLSRGGCWLARVLALM